MTRRARFLRDIQLTARPFGTIGYKEAAAVVRGEMTEADAIAETKRRTRAYAKRQMTWLRSERNVHWVDAARRSIRSRAADHRGKRLKSKKSLLLAAALVLAACTPTVLPPPMVAPQGDDRYLIDPRTGFTAPMAPPVAQKLEAAWRYALAGNDAEAQRSLAELRQARPSFAPATLLEAFLAIRGGRYDDARRLIERVQERDPENLVARVYEAEIAVRERRDAHRVRPLSPDRRAARRARRRRASA